MNATTLGSYANFLSSVRQDVDRAEMYYQRAIAADPNHATNLGNYAVFLQNERKDYDGAETFYQRAIAADPMDAHILANYAIFLATIRRADEGTGAVNPHHAIILGTYAVLLKNVGRDFDRAEMFFEQAVAADPKDATNLGNYANFLARVRRDDERAGAFYRRAREADPSDAHILANYAGFLLAAGHEQEGLATLNRALDLPFDGTERLLLPGLWFYAFVHRPRESRGTALCELRRLLEAGERSPGWDFTRNVERACEDGHPDCAWLRPLASIIAGTDDIESLKEWAAWQSACTAPDSPFHSGRTSRLRHVLKRARTSGTSPQ